MVRKTKIISIILVLTLICSVFPACKPAVPKTEIPSVYIYTENEVTPKSKETYVNASFYLETSNEDYKIEDAKCGIRLRGNSTYELAKKGLKAAYRLKFDKKQSLFGEGEYKSWVLLADYLDPSLMRNYSAYYFASLLDGMEFAPSYHHVEVYLNDVYQGVYLLTDQVQEQKEGRVPIEVKNLPEEQVPFLLCKNYRAEAQTEMDYDWFELNDRTYNICPREEENYYHQYSIKYPEGLTKKQYDYIVNYFKEADHTVKTGSAEQIKAVVDVKSLYDFYIVNDLFFNGDALYASTYLYKSADSPLIKFGPVWDFDFSLHGIWTSTPSTTLDLTRANCEYFTYEECWLKYICEIASLREEYKARWQEVQPLIRQTINHVKEYKASLNEAAKRNSELWYKEYTPLGNESYTPVHGSLFDDQYQYLIDFLEARINYLNTIY